MITQKDEPDYQVLIDGIKKSQVPEMEDHAFEKAMYLARAAHFKKSAQAETEEQPSASMKIPVLVVWSAMVGVLLFLATNIFILSLIPDLSSTRGIFTAVSIVSYQLTGILVLLTVPVMKRRQRLADGFEN